MRLSAAPLLAFASVLALGAAPPPRTSRHDHDDHGQSTAGPATHFLVSVARPGEATPSLAIVPAGAAGIE